MNAQRLINYLYNYLDKIMNNNKKITSHILKVSKKLPLSACDPGNNLSPNPGMLS